MTATAPVLSNDQHLDLYRQMLTIRAFEETVLAANRRRLVQGAAHTYIGMEAVAVGVCAALAADDYITSTHRGHGHCIARGLDVKRMLAEIFGRATGYCKGKGGSMHIADVTRGMLGADGIVAGGIPVAVGAALGCRIRGSKQVVACFFGDGAANQGAFHEAINLAAVQRLPVLFVCENNHWALSAAFERTCAAAHVADRAAAYEIPGELVDGNDLTAVYAAAAIAVDRMRRGEGPSLIECVTYRWQAHSVYATTDLRPAAEIEAWKEKDPIARSRRALLAAAALDAAGDAALAAEVAELMAAAEAFASAAPHPDPAAAALDVYA